VDAVLGRQEVYLDAFEHQSDTFLVARQNDRLAGSVMGIVCEELYGECKPFMVVEDVIVDQNHRRQGVGSLLMRELERLAITRDCAYIIFVTEQDRTTAHQFYESLGYNPDKYRGFKKRLGGGQQPLSPRHDKGKEVRSGKYFLPGSAGL
jgi:GNAT superfamily N-acetyltransferase